MVDNMSEVSTKVSETSNTVLTFHFQRTLSFKSLTNAKYARFFYLNFKFSKLQKKFLYNLKFKIKLTETS